MILRKGCLRRSSIIVGNTFGCRITRLFQYLTEDAEYKEFVQSKQIYKSGTSIGANVRESKHAQSDADFLSKMSIAYKEADETDYWLNLLHDNGYINESQYESLKMDVSIQSLFRWSRI